MKRTPLHRRTPLKRTPLARKPGSGLRRTAGRRVVPPCGGKPLRRTRIRPVSVRRKAENAERRRVCMEHFGENPACARCGRPADHAHELTPRSAGGSIVDPANIVPLCAQDHAWVHAHPIEARAEGWLR